MPRMHGERAQDSHARRNLEAERKRVTEEYLKRMQPNSVEWPIACSCSAKPYPHLHHGREKAA